jgi:Protein of unknown function (DUF2808)
MHKLLHLTSLSLAIATLSITGVRAQETSPVPGGTTTPGTTTPDTTTPGTTTPVTPTTPAPNAPLQGGLCNPAVLSSANANSEMTYTAGPVGQGSAYSGSTSVPGVIPGERANVPSSAGQAYSVPNYNSGGVAAASTGNYYSRVPTYSQGVNVDAPRLLSASSSPVQEYHEIGPAHRIKLFTGASPLCYVSVQPVSSTIEEANEKIRVFNRTSGKEELGITVTRNENRGARIVFAQPVPPGSTIEVILSGVNYNSQTAGDPVLYSLAGGHADFNQEIPYGIAQVNRFLY